MVFPAAEGLIRLDMFDYRRDQRAFLLRLTFPFTDSQAEASVRCDLELRTTQTRESNCSMLTARLFCPALAQEMTI